MNKTLPLPPTLNQTYKIKDNRLYKTQDAKDWQEVAGWLTKVATPLKEGVSVEINMFLKFDRDIDSSLKLVLDTLADVGVYGNDRQVTHLLVTKAWDKVNPRMEIIVSEYGGEIK